MRVLKRVTSGTSAAVLTLSTIMSMGITGVAQAVSTCQWTGASSNVMSVPGNWAGCGGVPQAGDVIEFTAAPASGTTNLTNDLGYALGGVIEDYDVDAHTGNYNIDTLDLTTGALLSVATQTACSTSPVTVFATNISSAGSVTDDAGILNNTNTSVVITGNVTLGYNNLFVNLVGSHIDGGVTLTPPVDTTKSGCTESGGRGGGGGGSNFSGFGMHSLTVQNGVSTALGDVSFPLTLGGGSGTGSPQVSFYADYDDSANYKTSSRTVSGSITLLHDAAFYVGEKTTVNITGAISGSLYKITRTDDSQGPLINSASSDDSLTGTATQENQAKTTPITDNLPTTDVTVNNKETTVLDGTRQSVSVLDGGILQGTGTVHDLFVESGGTVAPGHSPGKLTVTSSLNLLGGSTYQAQLKDTAAGDFDQLVVGDAAHTTGHDVTLGDTNSSPILDVELYDGYKMKAGDQFKIIDNVSGTPVSGTFNALPEGATFSAANGSVFKISYVGGDGNDVVLTVVTAPKTPDTGFALMSSHPGATLGLTVLAAATIFAIARTNRKPAPARVRANSKRR